jgi:hypothetical protein
MVRRDFEGSRDQSNGVDSRVDCEGLYPVSDYCGDMLSGVRKPGVCRVPIVPPSPVTDCLEVWRTELVGDSNAAFILDGIENGFKLVDSNVDPPTSRCRNYKSTLGENRDLVEAQIKKEVDMGRYIVCEDPPQLVSALGAIPKSAGKIRIIHDLSRPDGGMNRSAVDTSVHYPTLDDATKHMTITSYLAKIDLREAYRSIPVHKSCFGFTGLQWQFLNNDSATYMFDSRLPFGASLSCKIFQSLTDAIVRMLKCRNIISIGYVDDFMIVCDSLDSCTSALKTIIDLVESLGLTVNEDKVAGPSQKLIFLGVEVDCRRRTLSLPPKKLLELSSWCLPG